MRTELYKITTGSLLHDVGKVVHRTGDSHSHAESGYAFLKEQTGLDDAEILQQVRFHHAAGLKNAGLAQNSLAYITYIADNKLRVFMCLTLKIFPQLGAIFIHIVIGNQMN